jgi:hypothetical protein
MLIRFERWASMTHRGRYVSWTMINILGYRLPFKLWVKTNEKN